MTTYGITDAGFVLKRLEDILLELNAGIQTIYPDANITSESGFGQLNGLFAGANSQDWESFQDVSNQYNPSNASGPNLDSLVQLNGLTRLPAKASTVILTCTGTNGTIITAGSLVTNASRNIFFSTDVEVTIGISGPVDVAATATEEGARIVLSGTLTTIVNPKSGWSSVVNNNDANIGREVETDEQLRIRRDNSTLSPSQAVVEAIYSNLADTDGVEFARVYVNETDVTDSRGIPSHAISPVVVGGSSSEIAEVIFNRKSAGITSFGNTLINVVDIQGFSYPISFVRPDEIEIYLAVTVTAGNNFPVDGAQQIKDAILAYAAGGADELGAIDFGNQDGFPPGADVIFSRLYTPINSVPGHQVDSLFIDTSASPIGTSNITINYDEVSSWDSSRINVTVN